MPQKTYLCCDYYKCRASVEITGQEFSNPAGWKLDGAYAYCPVHVLGPKELERKTKLKRILDLRKEADELEQQLLLASRRESRRE